jgi:hypothetical protein
MRDSSSGASATWRSGEGTSHFLQALLQWINAAGLSAICRAYSAARSWREIMRLPPRRWRDSTLARGEDDGLLRTIRAGDVSLLDEFRGDAANQAFPRMSELIELKQFRRKRAATGVALTPVGVNVDANSSRHYVISSVSARIGADMAGGETPLDLLLDIAEPDPGFLVHALELILGRLGWPIGIGELPRV